MTIGLTWRRTRPPPALGIRGLLGQSDILVFEFAINRGPKITLDMHPIFVPIGPCAKFQGARVRTQGCNVGLGHWMFDHSRSLTRGLPQEFRRGALIHVTRNLDLSGNGA